MSLNVPCKCANRAVKMSRRFLDVVSNLGLCKRLLSDGLTHLAFSFLWCLSAFLFTKMSILQKIAEVEAEMARTQKNKATNYHLGLLKAKLAKLRAQLVRRN